MKIYHTSKSRGQRYLDFRGAASGNVSVLIGEGVDHLLASFLLKNYDINKVIRYLKDAKKRK